MHTTLIQKWGNSQAVRLPKAMTEALMLRQNDPVEMVVKDDSIVIRKAARKRRSKKGIEERFDGYDGDYQCCEWDTGKPVGSEVM